MVGLKKFIKNLSDQNQNRERRAKWRKRERNAAAEQLRQATAATSSFSAAAQFNSLINPLDHDASSLYDSYAAAASYANGWPTKHHHHHHHMNPTAKSAFTWPVLNPVGCFGTSGSASTNPTPSGNICGNNSNGSNSIIGGGGGGSSSTGYTPPPSGQQSYSAAVAAAAAYQHRLVEPSSPPSSSSSSSLMMPTTTTSSNSRNKSNSNKSPSSSTNSSPPTPLVIGLNSLVSSSTFGLSSPSSKIFGASGNTETSATLSPYEPSINSGGGSLSNSNSVNSNNNNGQGSTLSLRLSPTSE
ncbi:hypothetical protein QR98_0065870 [Sarcoptes scabiei]|uniref:Uncharacterized protein n=1 Tax=Sarcoptes scabiei TaxID=52283 RepID=A0A132AAX6_SARSC|nr:hypothetical protein QR98_0065870 [Sarcoptes scabiei]